MTMQPSFLKKMSAPVVFTIGILGALFLGWLDYVTGAQISFSVFYLAPVVFVAWYAEKRQSMFIAAICAVIWFVADHLWETPYTHPLIPYWNAVVRLGFFIITAQLVAALRTITHSLGKTVERRTRDLRAEIEERKRAETILRESEERFNALLQKANDAILFVDQRGTVIFWNRKAEELYGYTRDEILGKNFSLLVPRQAQQAHTDWMQRCLSGENLQGTQIAEGILERKDGELRYVETSNAVLRRGAESVLVGIVRDITERKHAEAERIQLSSAIEQAAEIVIILNTDGSIRYVNPSVEQILGYRRDELIGRRPFIFQATARAQVEFDHIWAIITGGNSWQGRLEVPLKNGIACILELTFSPIRDHSGNVISFLSVGRDITSELRKEDQLRQAQKMEAIGTLAGGIAHDFNNILAIIIGYTEITRINAACTGPMNDNLDQILLAADRATELVRQILTFSRKQTVEKKPVQLHLIIEDALKMLRASLPATIEIRQHIRQDDAIVMADPTQIQQILMNLCTNAFHAMEEQGGVIEVTLDSITLGQDDVRAYAESVPGPYARLSVRDTGTGIDQQIIDRIFDPFFTTKASGKGTGMGLAVIHGIVKNHGGMIRVYSEVGRGTVFHVYLPIREGKTDKQSVAAASPPRGHEHILFVDDEELLLKIGAEMLQSLGYTVTTAKNGSVAFDLLSRNPAAFDLLITDHAMPQATGFELAKKALAVRPDLPVILCTGYSEAVSEEKAKAAGIHSFILKPLTLQALAQVTRSTLDMNKS